MKNAKRWLAALALTLPFTASASEWELDIEAATPADVAVYTRYVEGQQMKEFMGVTTINASMAVVLAVISDPDNNPNWVYSNKLAKVIKDSEGNPFYYIQIVGVWPTSDRDVVLDVSPRQDPVSKTIYLESVSIDGIYPEQEDYVRMPSVESSYELRPMSPDHTQVTFTGHGDPGGSIPKWLANLYVTNIPEVSLTNLHEQVKRDKYRSATWDSIDNAFFDLSDFEKPYKKRTAPTEPAAMTVKPTVQKSTQLAPEKPAISAHEVIEPIAETPEAVTQ
ncbi:MAG: START domain-containing protein [Pseudomonadota bacterium]|nr:START domain-containing protein [Pseudomonadota bacterium]